MKSFLGRKTELQKLSSEYKRESSFVVMYGRCRVGKTTLIKEFIKDKKALYFLSTSELEINNRNRFIKSIADFTGMPYLKNSNFDNWYDIFEIIVNYQPEEKKIIVIDEFQYLVNANPSFTSIFQRIWDDILKDNNIMVILCGSYISMMTTQVLHYSSPLYGRRTCQMKLKPLKFTEIKEGFRNLRFNELVSLYAVTGGVPKYLEFFDNNLGFFENIKNEILDKNGFLYEEPTFLLQKEVRETMTYFSMIQTIADNNHKLSKIASALEVPATKLTPYIKTLMDLSLVEKRIPVTEKNPSKSKKGLYYIEDNFIEFWFRFVYPYKSELEMENIQYVVDKIKNNLIDNHVSFVYEDICREQFVNQSSELGFIISKIGSYWDSKVEIDIVAIDNDNKKLIVGECKYLNKPMKDSVFYNLIEKADSIKGYDDYDKVYVLFSLNGFEDRIMNINNTRNDLILFDNNK
ncbi:ATP-binding protein [Vallitalea guaymasensis]|uniref:ATP-binding protein n=1 Tax=Vallitalea guaymasensis TaxID=1185412 RepID=A0A8J8M955_9FIRM|nr:ATP-binding protein [Vallitalea guaymasensis]QUH28415.1 ATP-binding protein [Vallitalea guaymasensis]